MEEKAQNEKAGLKASKQAKKDLLKSMRRGTKSALLKLPQRYSGQSSLVYFPYASVSQAVFSLVSLFLFLLIAA